MSRFCPLFSSSKGNSVYLSGGDTAILVDAGISCRALVGALSDRGLDIGQVAGILITHEHSDHIQGLKVLLKRYSFPVYASRETLEYLIAYDKVPPGAVLVECTPTFTLGEIQVTPFPTPHDAIHSLGFRLDMPDGRKVAVATDLGHVSDTVHSYLSGCDMVMLESNYDPGMLECSSYPYILKRRIKSPSGHLSNEDCSREIKELIKSGVSYFALGHLSEQNNLPQLAHQASRAILEAAGMRENLDYMLQVAPARGESELLVF